MYPNSFRSGSIQTRAHHYEIQSQRARWLHRLQYASHLSRISCLVTRRSMLSFGNNKPKQHADQLLCGPCSVKRWQHTEYQFCWQLELSINLYAIYHYCVYSEKLSKWCQSILDRCESWLNVEEITKKQTGVVMSSSVLRFLNLTFRWPCIVINSCNKTN